MECTSGLFRTIEPALRLSLLSALSPRSKLRDAPRGRPRPLPDSTPGRRPLVAHIALYARHVRKFASWLEGEHLTDDVAQLEPEHVARFVASAEAQRQPDGKAKRTGSLNALRSSLRGFFESTERAGIVDRSPAPVLRMARVGTTPPKGLRPEEVAALLAVLAADTSVAGQWVRALFTVRVPVGHSGAHVVRDGLGRSDPRGARPPARARDRERTEPRVSSAVVATRGRPGAGGTRGIGPAPR